MHFLIFKKDKILKKSLPVNEKIQIFDFSPAYLYHYL